MSRFVILALGLFVAGNAWGQAGSPTKGAEKVATVDGQPITDDELAPMVQGQLRPLREQEYQIRKKALDSLITQRVLEAEAKKKNLTAEQLLAQEVDAKMPDPSDAEINAVYAVQKDQINRPLDEVKLQIAQNLKRAKIQMARQEYSEHLRQRAQVAVLLSPPRVQVGVDPKRVKGNPKAPVMIVEFSDFQCPFCGQVEATLKSVMARHADNVALAFRDMPIEQIHPRAQEAAEAARCAGEQDKFWEYHDLLFADQAGLDHSGLIAKAAKANLNAKQFEACLTSGKFKALVQQDNQEGMLAGVSGTPGFFINGVFLSGAQPEAVFEKVIGEQLTLAAAAKP